MKKDFYENRAEQCHAFKAELVAKLPVILTARQHTAIRESLQACFICGAAEERSRILTMDLPDDIRRAIEAVSVAEVLGFKDSRARQVKPE